LDPTGRKTAPAAAAAAIHAINSNPDDDPLLLVLPADHVIADNEAFLAALNLAEPAALAGDLVTFGIVPTRAETGYGYIRSQATTGENDNPVRAVAEFVEKPTEAIATEYVQSGDYLWNSGIFLFSAAAYLKELRRYAPEIADACDAAITEASVDLDFLRLDTDAFSGCPKDSIDFAVMEKTDRAVVVPLDAGWSDVGSFAALFDVLAKDANGNVFEGDVVAIDTRHSLVSAGSRMVATVGIEDCVVIETKDSVLVSTRERSQDVRRLVDQLRENERPETDLHRQVFRPWGSYDGIDQGDGFQVKRLIVNPGAKLSVQMHHQRDEHWTVVAGTARVTRDDDQYLLEKNESTFIPRGAKHSIENPGTKALHIIEVQVGDYLGEDDIVRFEDRYGRTGDS
jgi:mannose-1-phosphate guanylyltransferase/mannose-6-phosphate isomerase